MQPVPEIVVGAGLLQQFLYKSEHPVWHISEWQVKQGGSGHDRPLVRECIKAQLAVIVAHTRVSDTSERYVLVGNVHYGIIDA